MFRKLLPFLCLSLVILAARPGVSQIQSGFQSSVDPNSRQLSVTATAGKEQVRFASFGITLRMRLEVLDQAGDRVYDSDFRDGSLLDWKIDDQQGRRLPGGLYGCLVTLEDLTGQPSFRRGAFWLKGGEVRFGALPRSSLGAAMPVEGEEMVTVLHEDKALPMTYLAHDGQTGRIVSGSGGLSFRVGDMLAGKDVEYMRLTADGRLGLGVEEPAAKLDVAGMIRTSEGIMFPDGTILGCLRCQDCGGGAIPPRRSVTSVPGSGWPRMTASWMCLCWKTASGRI